MTFPEKKLGHDQEVDVWWGSRSPRTLLPSLVVSLALSALIVWVAWQFMPRAWVKLTIPGLLGLFWVPQSLLWCRWLFGLNYRLTNHRLFREHGIFWRSILEVDLARIAQVVVKKTPLERRLGVGHIILVVPGTRKEKVILDGVFAPETIAEQIKYLSARRSAPDRPLEFSKKRG